MSIICENLAGALQRYRAEQRLSVQALADRLEMPKSSVENYLKGNSNPCADTLELISKKTGIPLTEIVSGPAPGLEQAETIVLAAKELSGLPFERLEEGLQYLHALTALFSGGIHS